MQRRVYSCMYILLHVNYKINAYLFLKYAPELFNLFLKYGIKIIRTYSFGITENRISESFFVKKLL
jgi:hypothetical protein